MADAGCVAVTAFGGFVLAYGACAEFAVVCEGFAVPSEPLFGGPPNGRWEAVLCCVVFGLGRKGFEYNGYCQLARLANGFGIFDNHVAGCDCKAPVY